MIADMPIESLVVDGVTYYLPANEAEVMHLVDKAHYERLVVCLRGAAHSRPLIRKLEDEAHDGRLYLLLSKMIGVTFNDVLKQATVQGGCHLGMDPSDPTSTSSVENSLFYQLDQHRTDPANPATGWAIVDMGGIIHQTVGGFLSTGSSGSNLDASFNEQLISLTLVTGGPNGAQLQTFLRDDPNCPNSDDNPFFAVGVGLGLCGIIVSATFQCVESFNIKGQEATMLVTDCPIDLFGDKPALPSLPDFFRSVPYKRIMWWPQAGVDKAVVWQSTAMPAEPEFGPQPYQEVPTMRIGDVDTPIPAEITADLMMSAFGQFPTLLAKSGATPALQTLIRQLFDQEVVPMLLNKFVMVDGTAGPQQFQDVWYGGIPMDNRISDVLMPVWFTELWFPIDEGPKVLSTLRDFFAANPDDVGTFSYEIYPARASKFWLSAAYKTDVFRIDMFWFGDNPGTPSTTFYPAFWNLLEPLSFRPHWGKFLPASSSGEGTTYLTKRYPNFEKWLAVREKLDPQQVFVSDYWRNHLGIPELTPDL